MAAAMRLSSRRLAMPTVQRLLPESRFICSVNDRLATSNQTRHQAELTAQTRRKNIELMFQKGAGHGVKVQVKGMENMLGDTDVIQPFQHPMQAQLEDIEKMFEQTAVQRSELQSHLVEQQMVSSKQTELLTQSLEAVTAERVQLREQVEKLSKDLHVLTHQMLKEQVGVRERIQRKDVKGKGGQSRLAYRPTIEDAERQPTHVCELSHQTLAELSMLGNHCAIRERLLREIMAVDSVSWGQAHSVLDKFDEYNERYYWVESFAYRFCIVFTGVVCVVCSLLVFWKPMAHWYGANVAGEELPEGAADISELTTNQVGSWTWGWMEPMIGLASFVLLCCQFSRAQLKKMSMKTYGEVLLDWRANRLAQRFPEYDQSMVRAWAKHMPSVNMNMVPVYEKNAGFKGPTSGL